MGYGDVLVHTNGPSYGQPIVRNVGVSSGGGGGGAPDAHKTSHEDGGSDELDLTGLAGGFQNPYPNPAEFQDVVDFLEDIEMRDGKTLWLDTAKTYGFTYNVALGRVDVVLPATGIFAIGFGGAELAVDLVDTALYVTAMTLETYGSVAARAGFRIPSGTAPDAPADGDVWNDGAAHFHRLAGVSEEVLYV